MKKNSKKSSKSSKPFYASLSAFVLGVILFVTAVSDWNVADKDKETKTIAKEWESEIESSCHRLQPGNLYNEQILTLNGNFIEGVSRSPNNSFKLMTLTDGVGVCFVYVDHEVIISSSFNILQTVRKSRVPQVPAVPKISLN